MSNQHPIIPPPELLDQWCMENNWRDIAIQAAQWGADQELEACVKWLDEGLMTPYVAIRLRSDRRPKPPSLKEQALEQLDEISTCFRVTHMGDIVCDKIRKALEALPND